jgi:hypothetical protein
MKFNIHDFISKIIPGGLTLIILFSIVITNEVENGGSNLNDYITILKEFKGLNSIFFLMIAYLLGYVLDGLSSFFTEKILWKMWGGWPIVLLHQGKTTSRTTFPQRKKVFNTLSKIYFNSIKDDFSEDEYDELYYFAQSQVRKSGTNEQTTRQQDYINSYIFSRNLTTTLIIITIILGIIIIVNYSITALILLILILLFLLFNYYRCKDKALYQTRNLLNSANSILKK